MISAFVNCFKIPELRDKIFFTLFLLFIARVGANIPLPGNRPLRRCRRFFEAQSRSGAEAACLGTLQHVHGWSALLRGAIFALGIMPYISASIVFQLLTAVVPSLARLQQEGEVGRQKISQYTRYATLVICLVQSVLLILTLQNPQRIFPDYDVSRYGEIILLGHGWFMVTSVIFLTSGTILLMWIGEQITSRGIGNGISILITVGILADLASGLRPDLPVVYGTGRGNGTARARGRYPDVALPVPRHRRGRDGDAGGPEDSGAVRQAGCRAEGLWGPKQLPAPEGELLGRHADHFRIRYHDVLHDHLFPAGGGHRCKLAA
jgi:preprotein translocase subunit SecY